MKKIFLTIITLFLLVPQAFASKLPDDLWNYVKQSFPKASQRFDSVVVISDKVMYIPLYPPQMNKVEKISIDYTYPSNKNLKSLPEVVIFNNNFAFLKLFKDSSGNYTVTKNEDLPLKVKLGIMPQDMLVPVGMKIPENLKLVLGDLVIPSISDNSLVLTRDDKKLAGQIKANEFQMENDNFFALNELKGRKAYVTSNGSKFMSVYDETSAKPLYELKLNALPSKIAASNRSKLAVVLYYGEHNPEIIDLRDERVLHQIEFVLNPKDVIIDEATNLAYISSPDTNTIYVVDMFTSDIKQEIKMAAQPAFLAFGKNKQALTYSDYATQELYVVELFDNYEARKIAQTRNLAGLEFVEDNIYTVSRTQDKLVSYNNITGAIQSEIKLHKKPVSTILYNNKIFILCAQDGVIDVYDISKNKITKTIVLDKKGFYSLLTRISTDNMAFVTGVGTEKFLILDFQKEEIVKSRPLEIQVSNLMIIDK